MINEWLLDVHISTNEFRYRTYTSAPFKSRAGTPWYVYILYGSYRKISNKLKYSKEYLKPCEGLWKWNILKDCVKLRDVWRLRCCQNTKWMFSDLFLAINRSLMAILTAKLRLKPICVGTAPKKAPRKLAKPRAISLPGLAPHPWICKKNAHPKDSFLFQLTRIIWSSMVFNCTLWFLILNALKRRLQWELLVGTHCSQ